MRRLSRLGITREHFDRLWVEQQGKCAICGKEMTKIGMDGAHVDHDHEMDVIRGLLCKKCNSGIGMFRDSVDLLRAAICYLEKYALLHSQSSDPSIP
jgi:hypothetical protein